MSYNKDTDYQAKINEAVKSGDYESAAKYEKSRNEKIDGENLGYEKTNKYSGWLDTTDYSNVIRKQVSSGASKGAVSDTLKKRIKKASGTDGLTQYAYDDVYDMAIRYIRGTDNFSYSEKMPEYKSSYDKDIQKLYQQLADIQEFSYDPYSDDLFKYYKQQYNREGKRAMEDLLGELSMNTGGVASSYAVSAAAQSLDYYNSKLTDKIPQLYSDAYERYLDNIKQKEKNLEILSELSSDEYERYLDSIDLYNKNREFNYNMYSDSIDRELTAQKREDEIEESRQDYEYLLKKLSDEADENSRKAQQQEYENALKKWQALGYLDAESAEILGLPAGLHTSDYDYKKAQQYKLYR